MEGDRFVLRSITDEIMYELMLLSGQEYVDMYATSMKDRLLQAARAKAREIQEAAKPGSAARELVDALADLDDGPTLHGRPTPAPPPAEDDEEPHERGDERAAS